ncbi:MAG: hypothetical protein ACLUKN_17105 [Bacilli bacterium]
MLGVKIPDGEAIDSISALKNFRSASALGDRKEIVLQGTRENPSGWEIGNSSPKR